MRKRQSWLNFLARERQNTCAQPKAESIARWWRKKRGEGLTTDPDTGTVRYVTPKRDIGMNDVPFS